MTSDLQAQTDELEVLESIYTDEEFKSSKEGEELGGQFFANLDLPPNFRIQYRLLSTRSKGGPHKDPAVQKEEDHQTSDFGIEYLPPIVLYFTLPPNYPSAAKPKFLLSCKWLPRGVLSKLCRKLDQLWEDNKGVEVLFLWTQFLKEESLAYLNITNVIDVSSIFTKQINYLEKKTKQHQHKQNSAQSIEKRSQASTSSSDLRGAASAGPHLAQTPERGPSTGKSDPSSTTTAYSPSTKGGDLTKLITPTQTSANDNAKQQLAITSDNAKKIVDSSEKPRKKYKESKPAVSILDERAVLDLPLTELVHLVLQEYNQQRPQHIFSRTMQNCNVCFSAKMGSDCIGFEPCGHVFCVDCIRGYFEVQVRDGQVNSLKCLEDKCNSEPTPSQVKRVLSPEIYEKYDAALLSATLDTMPDIIYCPNRKCQYPVTLETDEVMGRCPQCTLVFCIYCKMTYHGIEPCKLKSEEQQRLVHEYQSSSGDVRLELEKRYGRKQLQTMVDTTLSEAWVAVNSQNCPKCGVSIEKSSGCNKMTCWKCNCFFCWLCSTALNPLRPYLHYNQPGNSCYNKLFGGVEFDEDDDEDDEFWVDFLNED